jgi:hypothetical protein
VLYYLVISFVMPLCGMKFVFCADWKVQTKSTWLMTDCLAVIYLGWLVVQRRFVMACLSYIILWSLFHASDLL